jgi:Luciferase-like monooxygenase
MQVDLLLDTFGARWAEVRDAASAAVDAGFAGIWTWDHLDGRVYGATHVLECWTVLTAIAVAVPDVMVGPLVLNVANRPPGVIAMMAASSRRSRTDVSCWAWAQVVERAPRICVSRRRSEALFLPTRSGARTWRRTSKKYGASGRRRGFWNRIRRPRS